MQTLQHILAAVDLSAATRAVLERGYQLAAAHRARYTVLHVLNLEALALLRGLLGDKAAGVSARLLQQASEDLQAQLAQVQAAAGMAVQPLVLEGVAGTVVPQQAQQADLLLAGAHGSGFLQTLLLGSTVSRLVRKSPAPVLVVKQMPQGPYRRVLVPVDFSAASALTVELARRLVPGADLELLHVFEVPFEGKLQFAGVDELVQQQLRQEARERAVQQLHALASQVGLEPTQYTARVLHGQAVHEVVAQARRDRCDLIVMGKHGTHVTEELLLGSVTQRVLAESEADVLVVGQRPHQAACGTA